MILMVVIFYGIGLYRKLRPVLRYSSSQTDYVVGGLVSIQPLPDMVRRPQLGEHSIRGFKTRLATVFTRAPYKGRGESRTRENTEEKRPVSLW